MPVCSEDFWSEERRRGLPQWPAPTRGDLQRIGLSPDEIAEALAAWRPRRPLDMCFDSDSYSRKVPLWIHPLTNRWTGAFARTSAALGGTGGWRIGDGGKSIALPCGRVFWYWGDSFLSYQNPLPGQCCPGYPVACNPDDVECLHGITGSSVTVSGTLPPPDGPALRFWARIPQTDEGRIPFPGAPAVEVTDETSVSILAGLRPDYGPYRLLGPGAGAFEFTGREVPDNPDDLTGAARLWPTVAVNVGNTLYLFYQQLRCPDAKCKFESLVTEKFLIYKVTGTNLDVSEWVHHPPVEYRPSVFWWWFYDDTLSSGYIYAFGLPILPQAPAEPPDPWEESRGNLYVARISSGLFPIDGSVPIDDYSRWEFLHRSGWRLGDDNLLGLRVLARDVGQEFSIHRVRYGTLRRWVLVHSDWRQRGFYSGISAGFGIIRVSEGDDFLSFPDRMVRWVDVRNIEGEAFGTYEICLASDDKWVLPSGYDEEGRPICEAGSTLQSFGDMFRGFSLHGELESPPGTVVVGYTIFSFEPTATRYWIDAKCGDRGRLGDERGFCGGRRFALLRLSDLLPWSYEPPDPPTYPTGLVGGAALSDCSAVRPVFTPALPPVAGLTSAMGRFRALTPSSPGGTWTLPGARVDAGGSASASGRVRMDLTSGGALGRVYQTHPLVGAGATVSEGTGMVAGSAASAIALARGGPAARVTRRVDLGAAAAALTRSRTSLTAGPASSTGGLTATGPRGAPTVSLSGRAAPSPFTGRASASVTRRGITSPWTAPADVHRAALTLAAPALSNRRSTFLESGPATGPLLARGEARRGASASESLRTSLTGAPAVGASWSTPVLRGGTTVRVSAGANVERASPALTAVRRSLTSTPAPSAGRLSASVLRAGMADPVTARVDVGRSAEALPSSRTNLTATPARSHGRAAGSFASRGMSPWAAPVEAHRAALVLAAPALNRERQSTSAAAGSTAAPVRVRMDGEHALRVGTPSGTNRAAAERAAAGLPGTWGSGSAAAAMARRSSTPTRTVTTLAAAASPGRALAWKMTATLAMPPRATALPRTSACGCAPGSGAGRCLCPESTKTRPLVAHAS